MIPTKTLRTAPMLLALVCASTVPSQAHASYERAYSGLQNFYDTVVAPAVLTAAVTGAAVAVYQGIKYLFTYSDQQAFEYCYRNFETIERRYIGYDRAVINLSELVAQYNRASHRYPLLVLYRRCIDDARTLRTDHTWLHKRSVEIKLRLKQLPHYDTEYKQLKALHKEIGGILKEQKHLAARLEEYAVYIKKMPEYEIQRLKEQNEIQQAEIERLRQQNYRSSSDNANLRRKNAQLESKLIAEQEASPHLTVVEINV